MHRADTFNGKFRTIVVGLASLNVLVARIAHPRYNFFFSMRDDFSLSTNRTLSDRAGRRCSNPACNKPTSGPTASSSSGAINIGVAAHITAASPGGKRYDGTLTKQQRASIENGIWLCQDCGKLVDSDEETYSVSVLRGWKEQAERVALESINGRKSGCVAILERRLAGHKNFVWDVTMTPDGRKVVSASNDKTVRIWDAATGAPLALLAGHEAFVCSVSVSPDGLSVAAGATDGCVVVWSISTGERKSTVQHGAADAKVSWQANNEVLVTGGADGELAFWNIGSRSIVQRCKVHNAPILKIVCLADCKRVASVSADKTIRVIELDAEGCTQVFTGHTAEVNSAAITPDELFLISASSDKTIRIWALDTGQCQRVLCGHKEIVWRVAVSPTEKCSRRDPAIIAFVCGHCRKANSFKRSSILTA